MFLLLPSRAKARDLGVNSNMYFTYIITNWSNTTLYIGFTSDLKKRMYQHREALVGGFARKYNLNKLVYYESGEGYDGVLAREKQIKKYSRHKKEQLILSMNSYWQDLYDEIE